MRSVADNSAFSVLLVGILLSVGGSNVREGSWRFQASGPDRHEAATVRVKPNDPAAALARASEPFRSVFTSSTVFSLFRTSAPCLSSADDPIPGLPNIPRSSDDLASLAPYFGVTLERIVDLCAVQGSDFPDAGRSLAAVDGLPPDTPPLLIAAPCSISADIPISGLPYSSQSGDDLASVAAHFGVPIEEVYTFCADPGAGYLDVGTPLVIGGYLPPDRTAPAEHIIPDSEVIFSLTAVDFNVAEYVDAAGGWLADYYEVNGGGRVTGGRTVTRLALDGSINPRLLLAFLQYYSGWVEGEPIPETNELHPLGYRNSFSAGLYRQMYLLTQDLSAGYYGWRSGKLTALTFPDGTVLPLAPDLNAGTAALQYHFSRRLNYQDWLAALDPDLGFMALYEAMFGDPWVRDRMIGALIPGSLDPPGFTLPFEAGFLWSFTGGPHSAWEQETAYAALDFSPAMGAPGCAMSPAWAVAIAPGLIVRSDLGYVVLDLDGDGLEQTGWDVVYLHLDPHDRIETGTRVEAGDRLGHPSCEGGMSTGTHLHIARKFNGEWIGVAGPAPFAMSGWSFNEGSVAYKGTMTKGDRTITACGGATPDSYIIRLRDE